MRIGQIIISACIVSITLSDVNYRVEQCQPAESEPISIETGSIVLLTSLNYPKSLRENCSRLIQGEENKMLRVQFAHYDIRMSGAVRLFEGEEVVAELPYDDKSIMDLYLYAQFKKLPIEFRVDLYDNETGKWNGFEALLTVEDGNDTSCILANNAEFVVQNPLYISSENQFAEYPLPAATCSWHFLPESEHGVKMFVAARQMRDEDFLYIFDSHQNFTFNLLWDEVLKPFYFTEPFTVVYKRTDRSKYWTPCFEAILSSTDLAPPGCSLAINNQMLHLNDTGSISIIQDFTMYDSNQQCTWTVIIPPQSVFSFNADIRNERFCDRLLAIEKDDITEIEKYYIYSYKSGMNEYSIVFKWTTDGNFGYYGFKLDYNVEHSTQETTTTPSTTKAPITISAATIKTTSTTSVTSTSISTSTSTSTSTTTSTFTRTSTFTSRTTAATSRTPQIRTRNTVTSASPITSDMSRSDGSTLQIKPFVFFLCPEFLILFRLGLTSIL